MMLVRRNPFEKQDEEQRTNMFAIYHRIMNAEYHIPEGRMSDECANLIKKILVVDPDERPDISKIQQHSWYQQGLPEGSLLINQVLDSQALLSDDEIRAILEQARNT